MARPFAAEPSSGKSIADRFIAMALQGDLRPAESLFTSMDPEHGPISDFQLAERFRARFVDHSEDLSPESGDSRVDALVSAYRSYWRLALMGKLPEKEGERFIQKELEGIFGATDPANWSGPGGVFHLAGRFLDEREFHHLETTAPPLLDLFVWKREYSRNYTVKLTDRSREVRVTFMDGMVSRGWKEFASLGLTSTTGWVDQGRLYCVEWAYDRTSERFTISFLKHEVRHLVDIELFTGISSTELEYRAKLTELAFASTSILQLLDDFTNKSSTNTASPHSYANHRVTRDIYRELYNAPIPISGKPWLEADTKTINAIARRLLRQNTELLQSVDSFQ